MSSVINLKGKLALYGPSLEKTDSVVYVGRAINMGGWRLKTSPFHNPFKVGADGTLDQVIEKFRKHIAGLLEHNPELLEELLGYKNKSLGCWCHPNKCHADILSEIINQTLDEDGMVVIFFPGKTK